MQKRKYIYGILILLLLAVGITAGCFIRNRQKNSSLNNIKGNLIISTFSEGSKGNIVLYDVEKDKETSLVSNCDASINGDLSKDGDNVVYVSSLNDSNIGEVYLHKIDEESSKDKKVADKGNIKVSPRFGTDNLLYYLTGDICGIMQIEKIDTETNTSSIIDDKSSDYKVDAMDIIDNKVIMSSILNSVYQKQGEKGEVINHSIYEIGENEEKLKKIIDFQASSVISISYTPDGCNAIIGGCDINGEAGEGIYKISLEDGSITTLLNSEILFLKGGAVVSDFADPNLCKMSADERLLYFTGVPACNYETDTECYSTAIFSYNLESNEIKKVYEPKDRSSIFGLNIKY